MNYEADNWIHAPASVKPLRILFFNSEAAKNTFAPITGAGTSRDTGLGDGRPGLKTQTPFDLLS